MTHAAQPSILHRIKPSVHCFFLLQLFKLRSSHSRQDRLSLIHSNKLDLFSQAQVCIVHDIKIQPQSFQSLLLLFMRVSFTQCQKARRSVTFCLHFSTDTAFWSFVPKLHFGDKICTTFYLTVETTGTTLPMCVRFVGNVIGKYIAVFYVWKDKFLLQMISVWSCGERNFVVHIDL